MSQYCPFNSAFDFNPLQYIVHLAQWVDIGINNRVVESAQPDAEDCETAAEACETAAECGQTAAERRQQRRVSSTGCEFFFVIEEDLTL